MPTAEDIQAAAADAFSKSEAGLAASAIAEPEVLAPKPQPQQQAVGISEEDFQAAAADALQKTSRPGLPEDLRPRAFTTGPGPLGTFGEAPALFAKRAVEDIVGIPAAMSQFGAAAMGLQEAPNLQGMSIPQVQATKAQMQKDLQTQNEILDNLMKAPSPDDTALYLASQRVNSLEARIGQADDIVATHRPLATESPMAQPIGNALRGFGQQAPAATKEWLDQAFPTTQDYANSLFGQIEQFGADGLVLGAAGAALGPVGAAATGATLFGNQAYAEAKRNGADDETAERASLLTGVVSSAAMGVVGEGVSALGRSFAGLTAKQGINAITKTLGTGAIRVVGGQAQMLAAGTANNAIAKLTGYDPNRKLGASFWQNFWMGSVFGTIHAVTGGDPELSQVNKPDVKVRSAAPVAEMPGDRGFVMPTAGAPPTPTGQLRPTPPVAVTGAEDTRTNVEKWDDFVEQHTREPSKEAPLMLGAPAEQPSFQLGAGTEPVYTGPPRPVPEQRAAQVLSLGAPSTQTLEEQGDGSAVRPEEQTAAPTAATTEAATPAVPVGKKATGYRVSWLDHEEQPDNPQYRFKVVRTKAEVQQQIRDLKQRNVTGVNAESLYEPKAWYDNFPQASHELQGYTQKELTQARDIVAQGFRDAGRNPDEVASTEWVRQMKNLMDATRRQRLGITTPETPAWYEGDQFAARTPIPAELPPDRRVGPDDVKRETQDAQEKMGMHDNLVYTPTVDQLPQHVQDGMTPQQMNTAQVVTDRKLGNVHVIGDRFNSLNDLRRAIIEETLPYRYRNVSQLYMTHDPTSNDLGNYDHIGDRPVLNTHALLRSSDPYREAAKTAMEEVNVHQGISRLLGPREGIRYVNAMNDIQAQFNRLQLNDILAQQKGYGSADEMAAAYKVPNWKTDPRQAHKMTEELVGAYSRTFKTPEELTANAPSWYQLGLRSMATGIRRFLGLRVDPYDVQGLVNDSAAALRIPKWGETSAFHPIGDSAKNEMQQFQFANRPPTVAGEEGAAGPGETADIGSELVRARLAQLQRQLQPGQQLRTQAVRFAQDQSRTIQERLKLLRDWPAIIDHEGWDEVMKNALTMYNEDFGADPNRAMDFVINSKIDGARNPIFAEVTSRKATDQIVALRQAGRIDDANLMAARLDRMNQISLSDATEAARETAAQAMRHMNGSNQVARQRIIVDDIQDKAVNRRPEVKDTIDNGKDAVDQVTKDAANTLRQKVSDGVKKIAAKWGTTMSLPEQYTQDLVDRIHDAMFKTNTGFTDDDTPVLQRVYDTFRNNIQQIISERKTGVPTVQLELQPKRPAATDTLRTIIDNYPYYKQAWSKTMDMLYTENPELAQRFARSIEEPVGETLANKLASEAGTNLNDLVFNHFSTNDRLSSDLATKIMRQAGITGTVAQDMAQNLQNLFGDIVRNEQQDRLQSILKSVGGTKGPARGELNRLVDHIVIGGLDSAEWRNLVAPRFGIMHITPEQISDLRSAGDYMSYLRDTGMANTSIAQGVRQQIGDIMRLSRPELGGNKLMDQIRYLSDVYAASLLTGPLTHAPYWQQAAMSTMWNSMTQAARVMAATKGEVNPEIINGLGARFLSGWARGANEFLPILRSGIKPQEEFLPMRGGQAQYRGSLEQVEPKLGDVGSWFANYRYVRNFLDAVSNLMVRGSQYATHHALATKLAWEDGLTGQAAYEAADRTVMGTPEQQQAAIDESHRIVDHLNQTFPDRPPITEDYRKMLEGELLDRYKTTSNNPDSMLADTQTQDLRDIGRRAMAPGLRGALRGDVPGMWGKVSRGMLNFASDYPGLRTIAPFLKVPFNLVNEHLAWTPIGMWRSAADLVPTEGRLGRLISEVPGLRGGIEQYIGDIPGMKQRIESGEISQDQMRDLAWEQMLKGIIGTSGGTMLYAVARSMLNNPEAPLRFTYTGPSNYGQQEIERGKGWQPNSVYFGGAWHSYENTPFRALFAGIGAMSDYFRYEKQQPDAGMNELSAAYRMMQGGMSSVFGSPLQGPEAMMQMLTGMAGSEGVARNLSSFASQAVASVLSIPFGGTGTRQLLRLVDPAQYEATTPWGKFLRYVPVVNGILGEPKLNVFGEHMYSSPLHNIPEYTPAGGLFGIPKTGQTVDPNDPVWNYLADHPGLHLTMPGNNASVARIKMTPEEIYVYHLARGPMLKQELSRVIADPHFSEMPEARQNYIIKHVYEHEANQVGAAAVMRYRQQHPVTPERRTEMLRGKGIEPPTVETAAALPAQQQNQ